MNTLQQGIERKIAAFRNRNLSVEYESPRLKLGKAAYKFGKVAREWLL